MRRIAQIVGRSVATISRVLARLGLFSLKALEPKSLFTIFLSPTIRG